MSFRPLHLEAVKTPAAVVIRVVGRTRQALTAAFTLDVVAGGNRSVHHGHALLDPAETIVCSTISVSAGPDDEWRAVLSVEPSIGEAYDQIEQSS